MQGVVFDIKRFAIHDGPGIRTTVFLKGCPLNCWWCHNPESINPDIEEYECEEKLGETVIQKKKTVGKLVTVDEVIDQVKKEQVFMEQSGGGITLSGGEPLLQFNFAKTILQKCFGQNIHTTLDTSGFVSKNKLDEIIPYTNLFLYDFKLFDSQKHQKYCGVDNSPVKNNLEYLIEKNANVIVRIPVIPTVNFENNETNQTLDYLSSIKRNNFKEVHLLPYHKIGNSKYLRFQKDDKMEDVQEITKTSLNPLISLYQRAGFLVVAH